VNINDTLRALNDLEARIPRADKNERRRLANRINDLWCDLTREGHEVTQCPACGLWDTEHHGKNLGLDNEHFDCTVPPVLRLGPGGNYVQDFHFAEDALDARPSLAAMSRIADQRIDARALDKALDDMGVGR
jgi:hypothetical protein